MASDETTDIGNGGIVTPVTRAARITARSNAASPRPRDRKLPPRRGTPRTETDGYSLAGIDGEMAGQLLIQKLMHTSAAQSDQFRLGALKQALEAVRDGASLTGEMQESLHLAGAVTASIIRAAAAAPPAHAHALGELAAGADAFDRFVSEHHLGIASPVTRA